jgi:hypothetical protein
MKPLHILTLLIVVCIQAMGQTPYRWERGSIRSSGLNDQIEVGGPLAGAEFHGSRPLPSRISLYAPVANSIDLSTDYWRRGDSRPLVLGIKVDDQPRRWLGKEAWEYAVAPNTVRFERVDGDLRHSITYEFGMHDVAAALTIVVHNDGNVPHIVELYTHLALTLRSCQTYVRLPADAARFDKNGNAILARFDDPRVARAGLFVQNVGAAPASWTTDGSALAIEDSGWSNWIEATGPLDETERNDSALHSPVAAFSYASTLEPGESLRIVQILGSTRQKELPKTLVRAAQGWKKELAKYADEVRKATRGNAGFHSGDGWTDSSTIYARAILAANQHYLDGSIVPMPCPAEYNFFFTHDVLLTDLSAVYFDPARVKRDLLYLQKHAKNRELPHAYYWKDDGFKTEYAAAGNWNNLWIILTTAAYYRHTSDNTTVLRLYPILTRSLEKTLTMQRGDLLHGIEPDWWDFGNAPGARAYLTTLTIRAIEEYVYLSARLKKNLSRLDGYERNAEALRHGLARLWDDQNAYLFNTTPTGKDTHFYMGPLLAAVYALLPAERARTLVATAGSRLLDTAIGIRTVSPADFHTDSVKRAYGVKENEAGDQFLYANGGIWYLGNAWYAWALRATGNIEAAFDFYRHTMTVDGILQSPTGQPALYEYRYANALAPDHGRVDKPTMMWSAGFCIGTAYRLAGFIDNVWNVTVGDSSAAALQHVHAAYAFGGITTITRSGKGSMVTRLAVDGRDIPSRILPLDAGTGSAISVEMGPIRFPFLDSVNAVLHSASFEPKTRTMTLTVSSYEHHPTAVRILTPWMPRSVALNGKQPAWGISSTRLGTIIVTIRYPATSNTDSIVIQF